MPKITPTPKEKRSQQYWKDLNKIIDPEVGIGLVDMGLIYKVEIKKDHAKITMTLTSPGCPVGAMLIQQVEDCMRSYGEVESIEVEVVWDPLWNQEMIDPDIRDLIFGF